jgi:hypothetical protein
LMGMSRFQAPAAALYYEKRRRRTKSPDETLSDVKKDGWQSGLMRRS